MKKGYFTKKYFTKGYFYLWIGCMALLLAGCGGKGGGGAGAANSKEYVYKAEEMELAGLNENTSLRDFCIKDGKMYYTVQEWKEESSLITVMSSGADGSDAQSFQMELEPNCYVSYFTPDGQGNYYLIYEEYIEEGIDTENYTFRDDYYLMKLDSGGKEAWRQLLSGDGQNGYWVNWMRVLADGRIAVSGQEEIGFYDQDGNVTGKTKLDEGMDGGIYFLRDGSAIVNYYEEKSGKSILRKLDINTGKADGDYEIPGGMNSYSLYAGADCDFMLVGNGGVYSYNLGDGEVKKLMDFIDSDINSSYLYNLNAVSTKEFYGMISDDTTGKESLMKFTKVDPKDVKDKTVLTLACNYMDWNVRKHVVEFNKTNPDYRIRIVDYSQYNTDEDYTIGVTRLNTDIVSGKMPDILLLNNELPVESYKAKGLFEDLYPYMDKDEDIHREDYFPNVLKSYENDGKLYSLFPGFVVYTVVGKTSDVGSERGWTLDDLNALMATKPEGTEVFPESTRESMLYYSMEMSGSQFIDWENGKCNFNSEGFISLLEFIKSFPESLPDDYYDNSLRGSYDSWFREGNVLLCRMVLDGFYSYNYTKKGTFGEDITLIGFPNKDGMGSVLSVEMELAMSSKSKNKDGVWQFLRYFLMDEYQENLNYGWPLSMKHVEALGKKAMQRPFYEDENGNKVEYDEYFYINDMEIPISPMSQEEIDEVVGFIKSVEEHVGNNQELINIITEEAAPYFAGQKNVNEVADIIQNRVQIYVNENR